MDKSVELSEVLVYNPKNVPRGAKQLNPYEALALRLRIINSWNKPLEVLPLKFGKEAVTMATFFSSLLVTYRSRSFFNLFTRFGLALSFVPCVLLPTGVAHHCFTRFVFNPILVGPSNSMLYPDCSICLQIREALIMNTCGLVLPLGFGFLSSAASALMTRSYPVPDLLDAKRMWRMFKLYSTSFRTVGTCLFLGQTIFGTALVYAMIDSNQRVLRQQKFSPSSEGFIAD